MSYLKEKEKNLFKYKKLNGCITQYSGGLHWEYENYKGDRLSIILHSGSYGGGDGLFEIMPSWRKPSEADDVEGFLSFGEVQKWIDELNDL